jgi:hypothetical protein
MSENAVLFVNIGWSERYDGKTPVEGNFAYLRTKKAKKDGAGETWLFVPDEEGVYAGGIGFGQIDVEALDVVFVAFDKAVKKHRTVAIFYDADWDSSPAGGRDWYTAYSSDVRTFPVGSRPIVDWPNGQRNRRWARGGKSNWSRLLKRFNQLEAKYPRRQLSTAAGDEASGLDTLERAFQELSAGNRERILAEVRRAVRDQRLRPVVLENWGGKCAACGLELKTTKGEFECEIAHVREVKDEGKDDSSNALPLCRTHHWAFDRMMWAIRPDDRVVVVHQDYVTRPGLKEIDGRKIDPKGLMDLAMLEHRWKLAKVAE